MGNFIKIVGNVGNNPQNVKMLLSNVLKNFLQTLPSHVKTISINVSMDNGEESSLTMKFFKDSIHFS